MFKPGIFNKYKRKIYSFFSNHSYISSLSVIEKGAIIYRSNIQGNVFIETGCNIHQVNITGKVTIGKYTTAWGPNISINSGIHPIEIGKFCSIAKGVSIQEYYHRRDRPGTYYFSKNIFKENPEQDVASKGEIFIENDVWIGFNSCILSGVRIGNGAIIGALSLVNKDVPDYAIVGGNPAKILGYRFDQEIIDRLLDLKWWDWSIEKIKANRVFFESPLTLKSFLEIQTQL